MAKLENDKTDDTTIKRRSKGNKAVTKTSKEKLRIQLSPKEISGEQIDTLYKTVMGRPSKYNQEMCKTVLGLMAQGKSKATVCVELGITEPTLYEWCDPNSEYYKPEFFKAIKTGELLSKAWWEEMGRMNLHNKDFNHSLWMMNMTNRFGYTRAWQGKIDISEHSYNHHHTVKFDPNDEQFAEILSILHETGAFDTPQNDIENVDYHIAESETKNDTPKEPTNKDNVIPLITEF